MLLGSVACLLLSIQLQVLIWGQGLSVIRFACFLRCQSYSCRILFSMPRIMFDFQFSRNLGCSVLTISTKLLSSLSSACIRSSKSSSGCLSQVSFYWLAEAMGVLGLRRVVLSPSWVSPTAFLRGVLSIATGFWTVAYYYLVDACSLVFKLLIGVYLFFDKFIFFIDTFAYFATLLNYFLSIYLVLGLSFHLICEQISFLFGKLSIHMLSQISSVSAQRKVTSSAFPSHIQPPERSQTHALIKSAKHASAPTIRPFFDSDLPELRSLHQEWFPVQYQGEFYNKISKRLVKTLVAVVQLTLCSHQNPEQYKKEVVVGAIIYKYQNVESEMLNKESWTEYLFSDYQCAYILTLGVIDEYRKQGVASVLLQRFLEEAEANQLCKYVYLHVVAYNSAKDFYEKKGFTKLKFLDEYYELFGKPYDGILYAKYMNGGRRRIGWGEWLKSLFAFRQTV